LVRCLLSCYKLGSLFATTQVEPSAAVVATTGVAGTNRIAGFTAVLATAALLRIRRSSVTALGSRDLGLGSVGSAQLNVLLQFLAGEVASRLSHVADVQRLFVIFCCVFHGIRLPYEYTTKVRKKCEKTKYRWQADAEGRVCEQWT